MPKRTYSGSRCSRGPWLRRAAPPASPAPSPSAVSLSGCLDCQDDKGEKTPRLRSRSNPIQLAGGIYICTEL